jgi:hypothetical protein
VILKNNIAKFLMDTKAEESTRETKEKLDGRNKEGHE